MNEHDLRRTVEILAAALSSLGIRFHVTGGLASSYYGEPRMTRDVDVVVRLGPSEGRRLVEALAGEFLIGEAAVREAITNRGFFQALHSVTLVKADFHVGERVDGELDRSVLREVFEGVTVPMVSKEDAILSKLIWIREGSARSRNDVVGMLLDETEFDIGSVRSRAKSLACESILAELEREAESLRGGS